MKASKDSSRPAKCSLGKILSPIRGFRHFIWKGKTRRIFNIFKMCNFASLSSKKRSKCSKGLHLGSPRSLVGLLLGPLEGFCSSFGSHRGTLWTPLGTPKSRKSWSKGLPGISLVFGSVLRRQKGPQKTPRRHHKATKMSPPKAFFRKVGKNATVFPTAGRKSCQYSCFHKTDELFLLLLVNQ